MKQSQMRGGLKDTVFKIKGNRIVKALAKMTKKKKKNLLRSKMQPNLKKEAWDKGRERGFYLGASKGASEASEGGAVAPEPGRACSSVPLGRRVPFMCPRASRLDDTPHPGHPLSFPT